ncbi:hypothetical protein N9N82_11935 [Luminiphilus sp.]|nr:hypothetical protein [Luminiphilus sp.]
MSIIKPVLAITAAVTLTACGLTESDKTNIAKATCSTIAETRNLDGAMRLQLVNEARLDLGEKLYTDDDERLIGLYQRGHCTDLTLNNEEYRSADLAYSLDLLARWEAEVKARIEREEEKARYAIQSMEMYGPCPAKSDITSIAIQALKDGETRHYNFLSECSKNS